MAIRRRKGRHMANEIIIDSGLPHSGTSLMMQILDNRGIDVFPDRIPRAATDNHKRYCECERVQAIQRDTSWLPDTRGKAFKMVSQLLYDLPPSEKYRIIFMERDFDEMLASQEKMLQRLGKPAAPREEIKRAYKVHLKRLHDWLGQQRNVQVLHVNYNDLVQQPRPQAERVCQFLGGNVDIEGMLSAVDPSLYRNRKA